MEGEPRNVSIKRFCELNGVLAEILTKLLKECDRRIERMEVEGMYLKKYYHKFLTAVNSGRRDFENLTPALIG